MVYGEKGYILQEILNILLKVMLIKKSQTLNS